MYLKQSLDYPSSSDIISELYYSESQRGIYVKYKRDYVPC
jgi:hypothetical protein